MAFSNLPRPITVLLKATESHDGAEFAKQAEEEGHGRFQAAVPAACTRLRPILMTSFAFIFGVLPLVSAKGANRSARRFSPACSA